MGQGRRKSQRDYSYHHRKRSITLEVENQDNLELMHYLGPAAIVRNRLESKTHAESRKREPTPFPKTAVETQSHTSNSLTVLSKTREATKDSPINVLMESTTQYTPAEYPSKGMKKVESMSTLLVDSLFSSSWIFQNDCRREVTEESKKSIEGIFDSLLSLTRQERVLSHTIEPTHLLYSLFYEKRDAVVRYLVNGCRYERIYGLSVHTAVLDILVSSLPNLHSMVVQALYETVLEFYEMERICGGNHPTQEDSLYIQETEYGQIHRVVELWSSSVNRVYTYFYNRIFNRESCEQSVINQSEILLRTGLLLIQLSSVVRKYRKVLVLPFVRLLSLSEKNIHIFLHSFACKLPVTCPKKLLAWLELICDIMDQCPILLNNTHSRDVTILLGKIMKLAAGSHIDCCIQSLTLLSNKRLLINHILLHDDCMKLLDNCIRAAKSHWHQMVREKGEELVDNFLDLMDA